jgi:DNA-binding NarL/FixJ family response regulator
LPGLPVVALAGSSDTAAVLAAVTAEMSGFVVRDASIDEIVAGLRCAAAGEIYLSPVVMPGLLSRMRKLMLNATPALVELDSLSTRETEVLRLMTRGLENAEIARELGISVRTVKAHVSSIFNKLGVENRVQAAVLALGANGQGAHPPSASKRPILARRSPT